MSVKCAEAVPSDSALDFPASDSPPFEPANYTITVGDDNSLQWDPPPKSKELGFALSYHFPDIPAMVDKMQAALRIWFRNQPNEPVTTMKDSVSPIQGQDSSKVRTSADLDPQYHEKAAHVNQETENKRVAAVPRSNDLPPRKRSKIPGQLTWRLGAESEVTRKPKKRLYTKEERYEVGKNRGKACDYHRRRKEKCHPAACPQNMLHTHQEPLPASGTHDLHPQDKISDDAFSHLNGSYSQALPLGRTSQDPSTKVYPLVPNKTNLGEQSMSLQAITQIAESNTLRLDTNREDIETLNIVHSNYSPQARAKDVAHPHSRAMPYPSGVAYETMVSDLREEPLQESRNSIPFELDLVTGQKPEFQSLDDQVVSKSSPNDTKAVRQSEKGTYALLSQHSSGNANYNSDTAIETVPPLSGVLEDDLVLELNSTEDTYPFLWPLSPDGYHPVCEHFSNQTSNYNTIWTEPCTCSCVCCIHMPLPPDYLSGNWNQMFDEPFCRPSRLNFDGFSKLILKIIEETPVRDIPEAGIAMLCAMSELVPLPCDPVHASKMGCYTFVRPMLETYSSGPKLSVPATGDEFVDLLAWAFDKWTLRLDCDKVENCFLTSFY